MAIEKEKPDLWTVLKRRKRTVAHFLEEAGVRTLSGLKVLVKSLETVYNISNKFMTEANGYVLGKIAEEQVQKNKDKKVSTTVDTAKDLSQTEQYDIVENRKEIDNKTEKRNSTKKKKARTAKSKSSTTKTSKNDNNA